MRLGKKPQDSRAPITLFHVGMTLALMALLLTTPALAQRSEVSYQGELRKDGSLLTGEAEMKFVILNGGEVLWSNDDTSASGEEPDTFVTVTVAQGIFSVHLGDTLPGMVPLTADHLRASSDPILRVWVNTGEGFEQLTDQKIASSPHALICEETNQISDMLTGYYARSAGGLLVQGTLFDDGAGHVGVGTTNPGLHRLTVSGTLHVGTGSAAEPVMQPTRYDAANPSYGFQARPGTGVFMPADDRLGFSVGGVTRAVIDSTGKVGVGTPVPFATLDVEGRVNVGTGSVQNQFLDAESQLQVNTNAGTGAVLALWQSGIAYGKIGSRPLDNSIYITNGYDGSAVGNASRSITLDPVGKVGIGTSTPVRRLEVAGAVADIGVRGGTEAGFVISRDGSNSAWTLHMRDDAGGVNHDLKFLRYLHDGSYGGIAMQLQNSTGNVGIGTSNPEAKLHVNPGSGSANMKLAGSELTDNYDGYLRIRSGGTYVHFDGANDVLVGSVASPFQAQLQVRDRFDERAIKGVAQATNATAITGQADNGSNAWAIYGHSDSGFGGYFEGKFRVDGNFSVVNGTKNFIMDHPLSPESDYLVHACVESPDVKNIYDGTIKTDTEGRAVVTLPSYFGALNRDFRYQLTVLGQFAQAIIEQEIENNEFVIRTDRPLVRVSWQVTGIRNDPWAKAHPMQVVVEKPAEEKGTYLAPREHGQPIEKGMAYRLGQVREEARAAKVAAARAANEQE